MALFTELLRWRRFLPRRAARFSAVACLLTSSYASAASADMAPHALRRQDGKTVTLTLPAEYEISIAAEGLKRARFFTRAPDGRIFVTGMHTRADNSQGVIYILDGLDPKTGRFAKVIPYLEHLRNPNNVAFYAAPDGTTWLYVALTDKLERFPFHSNDKKPSGAPEILAHYPDYGLGYKYGGWHLTRTVAMGRVDGAAKLFVSVGSSCNACAEKEEIRATLSSMNPDGSGVHILAHGLRNAVGLRWFEDSLYLTNMGADHLGDDAPDDTMFALQGGQLAHSANYGWPDCYFRGGKSLADPLFPKRGGASKCSETPPPFAAFKAHSSPLGLEHVAPDFADPSLRGRWLVVLHGSGKKRLQRGYKVVSLLPGQPVQDFITGFLQEGIVHGRPCDILQLDSNSFLLTDDYAGLVYYIRHK